MNDEELKARLSRLSHRDVAEERAMVYAPAELNEPLTGNCFLYGFAHQGPLAFNITDIVPFDLAGADDLKKNLQLSGKVLLGCCLSENDPGDALDANHADLLRRVPGMLPAGLLHFLTGIYEDGRLRFLYYDGMRFLDCGHESYTLHLDVFSRNTGILETRMMNSKTAVISGCGSVGSYVALELARSGVGRFLLIDHDVLSYANVCRHQCGISDVGRYKTLAVADRIRLINPAATVMTCQSVIENAPPALFAECCGPEAVIVGCADNRQGDLFACKIAAHYHMPMVSIGFWERAFAGEVFYWMPEDPALACYQCFTRALGDMSGRESVNRRLYTTQDDLGKVSFMPGISIDITFVSNIGTKIILDIINRNNDKYPPRLIDSLTQFTLVANTDKKELGGDRAEIFSYPLQVTTSIAIDKIPGCRFCGHKTTDHGHRA